MSSEMSSELHSLEKKKIGINIASHLDRAKLSKPETKLLFLLSIAPEIQ